MCIRLRFALAVSFLLASGAACSSSNNQDAAQSDVGTKDTGVAADTGVRDAGFVPDAAPNDTGPNGGDGPLVDVGGGDATPDASHADAAPDASSPDAANPDATTPDSGGTVYWVDPVQGMDTYPGTQSMPFKSIRHASDVITTATISAGPYTVNLADGTYSASNQTTLVNISFAWPTFLKGSAPGHVTIMGQAGHTGQENMQFVQGGGIQNVTFNSTAQTVHALGGTFIMSSCSVMNTGAIAYFTGDVVGTLDTTGVTISGVTNNFGDVYLDNTAQVTWIGGGTTITGGIAGEDLVFMRGQAQLTIENLHVSNYVGYPLVGYDQVAITIRNSTISGSGFTPGGATSAAAIFLGGSQTGAPSPTLLLDHTNLVHSLGSGIVVFTTSNTATVSIAATSSHIDHNQYDGISIVGNTNPNLVVRINADSATFDHNGVAGISSPRASITFSGTGNSVSSNGDMGAALGLSPGGIMITDAASVNSLVARNLAIANNSPDQIDFAGSAGSVLDLGTAASPGAVVFSGVTAGHTALNLTALITATAIGDTWMPNVQGANASGMYTTATTITGPVMGLNVTAPAGASVIVAQ